MSVAVIPMAEELGWSASDRGLVSSAFFWGYSATQIPAGWLSTKYVPFALLPAFTPGQITVPNFLYTVCPCLLSSQGPMLP